MVSYMDIGQLEEAVCLKAYCSDDWEDLKAALSLLVDEASIREIVPSLIDFHRTADDEISITLYAYPGLSLA